MDDVVEYGDLELFLLERSIEDARLVEEYHYRAAQSPIQAMRIKDIIQAITDNPDKADKQAAKFLLDTMTESV